MRYTVLIPIICLFFSCKKEENQLLGIWQSDSKFYTATYEIVEKESKVKGLVRYYNDDTTIYRYDEGQEHYIFNNLKKKENIFVDATAGATKDFSSKTPVALELISADTLCVTTYVLNKPLKEYWIRKNSN